jgi:hypothetical protein
LPAWIWDLLRHIFVRAIVQHIVSAFFQRLIIDTILLSAKLINFDIFLNPGQPFSLNST